MEIPKIGLGTWNLRGNECASVVEEAIKIGCRHIDTAQDDETLKIKVENQRSEGFTTVYFVFDNQGGLIGYKVSFETTDKTACYSFQVKLN